MEQKDLVFTFKCSETVLSLFSAKNLQDLLITFHAVWELFKAIGDIPDTPVNYRRGTKKDELLNELVDASGFPIGLWDTSDDDQSIHTAHYFFFKRISELEKVSYISSL
jgi:hypothetical protein